MKILLAEEKMKKF